MVEYYCGYCNKNVNYPQNYIPLCKDCGFYLIEGQKSEEERNKIQEERTTYCSNCNEMVYSVPIDLIIEKMEYKVNRDKQRVQNDIKRVKQEHKSKRVSFWDYLLIISIPFFLISLMVFGALGLFLLIGVGVILYFDYMNKRDLKKKRLKIREDTIQELVEKSSKSISELRKTRQHFENLCRKCMHGVNPHQKAPT